MASLKFPTGLSIPNSPKKEKSKMQWPVMLFCDETHPEIIWVWFKVTLSGVPSKDWTRTPFPPKKIFCKTNLRTVALRRSLLTSRRLVFWETLLGLAFQTNSADQILKWYWFIFFELSYPEIIRCLLCGYILERLTLNTKNEKIGPPPPKTTQELFLSLFFFFYEGFNT